MSGENDWLEGLREDDRNGVSPCFVNCGQPACQTLGCIRVYNARPENEQNGPSRG